MPIVESGVSGRSQDGVVRVLCDPGALVWGGGEGGLRAGGEEGGGEDGAAVEREAKEGLVGGVDERGGDGGDGELAEGDGAGEEEVLCAGSMAMEVMPGPGMKVEKRRPSPAGVSLVRKPEVVWVLGMMSGTRALRVG